MPITIQQVNSNEHSQTIFKDRGKFKENLQLLKIYII